MRNSLVNILIFLWQSINCLCSFLIAFNDVSSVFYWQVITTMKYNFYKPIFRTTAKVQQPKAQQKHKLLKLLWLLDFRGMFAGFWRLLHFCWPPHCMHAHSYTHPIGYYRNVLLSSIFSDQFAYAEVFELQPASMTSPWHLDNSAQFAYCGLWFTLQASSHIWSAYAWDTVLSFLRYVFVNFCV